VSESETEMERDVLKLKNGKVENEIEQEESVCLLFLIETRFRVLKN
jgi:hypothetical protein